MIKQSLEDVLAELERYGQPRLGVYRLGWHCDVELNIKSLGFSSKVSSEFGHKTPMAAAEQCLDYARAAMPSGSQAAISHA